MGDATWEVIEGDCLEVMRGMDAGSVDCCVTSPPYWGLRDYGLPPSVWGGSEGCEHEWGEIVTPAANGITHEGGMTGETMSGSSATRKPRRSDVCQKCGAWRGCYGLEPTPELYVEHTVMIFREVRRVLADHGTCWLNLGDSYAASRSYQVPDNKHKACDEHHKGGHDIPPGLKPKDLCGIPWRVAFALQADGWWLRSDIVWAKGWSFCPDRAGNPMPESVEDRPVRAHEYVFLLTKRERYFYDHFAVREAAAAETVTRLGQSSLDTQEGGFKQELYEQDFPGRKRRDRKPADILKHMRDHDGGQTRNLRDVWAINTQGYAEAHFATFPPALVEPMIRAGCPSQVCAGRVKRLRLRDDLSDAERAQALEVLAKRGLL